MFRTNFLKSTKSLLCAAAVTGVAGLGLWMGVQDNKVQAGGGATNDLIPAATFAADAASLGAIADGAAGCGTAGAARNVTFTVSGVSGTVSSVEVGGLVFGTGHSWGADITATLIAPNGASHVLFGRTGATTATSCGDSSPLVGPYAFADTAAAPPSGGWWQAAAASTAAIPTGTYRSTNSGGAGATNPMPATTMNPSFTGVTNANGTWTLRLTDSGGGDTGSVTAANLTVNATPTVIPDANADFDGDGKTDFTVARGTTTPVAGMFDSASDVKVKRVIREEKNDDVVAPPIYWYTSLNGSGTTGVAQLGDAATDFLLTEDFDGDGKDDIAVWTPGAATTASFKILQTSTNTVRVETFGQTGDDPAIIADYDGDGKADPAVFRCPAFGAGDGQCYFFYRGSFNNPSGAVTYVPWGFGEDGDFFVLTGDFDGDGKADFNLQRSNPTTPTQGQFVLLKSSGGIEYIDWGLPTDFLIPGDYDGDGKSDICVRRTVSGARQHYILTRTGATSQVQWGITGDVSAPGDYDGDGKTDIAIWRPSATPGVTAFWVLNSSNSSASVFQWGLQNDVPAASWYVH